MPKYSYSAFDSHGKQKNGMITALSDSEANSKLSSMGLMPTKVVQLDESIARSNKNKDAGSVKIKKKIWVSIW